MGQVDTTHGASWDNIADGDIYKSQWYKKDKTYENKCNFFYMNENYRVILIVLQTWCYISKVKS